MNNNINNISKKIIEMAKKDQEIRMSKDIDFEKMEKIDAENRKEIKSIVDEYGLVSISKFGKEASYFAWLLIQHLTTEELDFMEDYIKLMEDNKKDIDIRNYAYLKDRILVYKNKPQIYGTQTISKDNILNFQPIENISNVDTYREEVGLNTLKEYADDMKEMLDMSVELPKNYSNN